MTYELGSRQGRLNRNELARLRQIAAARLREEYPWMTYEQIARDVGYSAGSSVRNALRRLEDVEAAGSSREKGKS